MAFILDQLTNVRGQDKQPRVQGKWMYRTTDARATVLAADYFLNAFTLVPSTDTTTTTSSITQNCSNKFYVGDVIEVQQVDGANRHLDDYSIVLETVVTGAASTITSKPLLGVQKVTVLVPDISTANSSATIASPFSGTIIKMESTLQAVIASVDAVVTGKIGTPGAGTAITNGVLTIGFSSSAIGDIDTVVPTAANVVAEGDLLSVISNGGSTNAAPLYVTFYILQS